MFKASGKLLILLATNFIVGIVRTKLYAVYLGPAGFGIVSQLSNFVTVLSNVANLGSPLGLTTKISNLVSLGKRRDTLGILFFFLKIFLGVGLVILTLILLFSAKVSILLTDTDNFTPQLIIISLSLPFLMLYAFCESYLRGTGKIGSLVGISSVASILSILFIVPLLKNYTLTGAAIYLFISSVLPLTFFFLVERKKLRANCKIPLPKGIQFDTIFKIGIASLVASFLHQGGIIFIRKFIIDSFGYEQNGIYQSVLNLSLNSFAIFYLFLSNYTLIALSKKENNQGLIDELNTNFKFLSVIVFPISFLIITFRHTIYDLLYTQEFLAGTELILFQIFGDYFRLLAALLGLWLIVRAKVKQLIIIDVIFNTFYILLPILLVKTWGNNLALIPLGYSIAFFLHFVLNFFYARYLIIFKFTPRNLLILISTLLYLFFLLAIDIVFQDFLIKISLNLFLMVIMMFVNVRKSDFENLKKTILAR